MEEIRQQLANKEVVEVEYLWTGVEVREYIKMDVHGCSWSYTAVEGGKLGGRRGELRLRLGGQGEEEVNKFVDEAFWLAYTIGERGEGAMR